MELDIGEMRLRDILRRYAAAITLERFHMEAGPRGTVRAWLDVPDEGIMELLGVRQL